jgi:hypothetical protein
MPETRGTRLKLPDTSEAPGHARSAWTREKRPDMREAPGHARSARTCASPGRESVTPGLLYRLLRAVVDDGWQRLWCAGIQDYEGDDVAGAD